MQIPFFFFASLLGTNYFCRRCPPIEKQLNWNEIQALNRHHSHYDAELAGKKIYSFCSCYFTLFLFNIPQVLAFVLMLLQARWAFFQRQYALHSLIGIDFQRRGL